MSPFARLVLVSLCVVTCAAGKCAPCELGDRDIRDHLPSILAHLTAYCDTNNGMYPTSCANLWYIKNVFPNDEKLSKQLVTLWCITCYTEPACSNPWTVNATHVREWFAQSVWESGIFATHTVHQVLDRQRYGYEKWSHLDKIITEYCSKTPCKQWTFCDRPRALEWNRRRQYLMELWVDIATGSQWAFDPWSDRDGLALPYIKKLLEHPSYERIFAEWSWWERLFPAVDVQHLK